jgi:phenylalanyl-tRNA synthetase beta chain
LNWIKEFVSIPEIDPKTASVKFTMAACEVDNVEETGGHLKQIVAAKITEIKKHPEAENLNLVSVDNGEITITLVCGAPNVEAGKIVPFAKSGTKFPDGFVLEPKKIRGVESCGMLCSQKELGLGDDHRGLLILPQNTKLGATIAEIFGIDDDVIFDIDNKSITHRPDLWGHYGIAREFGLIFGSPLKNRFDDEWEAKIKNNITGEDSPISVEIKENTCCKAYYGISIDGVKVEESPKWMQTRLTKCGLRPINNIVDISNFVMLELGMPNHIFDRDLIEGGKIIIRQAGEQTKFITLDEIERNLSLADTVVADAQKPLVIAGIMGGANSGVNENTTKIFIESANWIDCEVRKTSVRIGLRTDSVQRYEKSLDSQLLERSLLRIVELVLEICPNAKVVGKIEKMGEEIKKSVPKTIRISAEKIGGILGKRIEKSEIIRILQGLDFGVKEISLEDVATFDVEVPTYRATKDVECEADIVEEIGRIVGYDNITPAPRIDKILPTRLSQKKQTHRKIQDFLVFNAGLLETMTNPMVGEKLLEKSKINSLNENLVLINAISKDHDRMRPSLIATTLQITADNSRNFDKFGCFEIAREYNFDEQNFAKEKNALAISLFDKKESRFMELVNILERLFKYLNVPAQIVAHSENFVNSEVPANWAGIHPTQAVDVKIMGKNQGFATTIHPIFAKDWKIKGHFSMALIDISAFENLAAKDKVKYSPLPKFPDSILDYTIVADAKVLAADILAVVEKLKIQNVAVTSVIDIFDLGDKKAVTLRTQFQDRESTLSPKFLEESQKRILDGLEKAGFPLRV